MHCTWKHFVKVTGGSVILSNRPSFWMRQQSIGNQLKPKFLFLCLFYSPNWLQVLSFLTWKASFFKCLVLTLSFSCKQKQIPSLPPPPTDGPWKMTALNVLLKESKSSCVHPFTCRKTVKKQRVGKNEILNHKPFVRYFISFCFTRSSCLQHCWHPSATIPLTFEHILVFSSGLRRGLCFEDFQMLLVAKDWPI